MINLTSPKINDFDSFCNRAKDIFESGQLTNNGKYLQRLENSLSEYLKVKSLLVSNGTIGLIITLQRMNLTGNVIVPSFTFCATVHALIWAGLKPNFVDIDEDTFNLNPKKVREAINTETSAILAVHVFGNPCAIDELQKIADENNLKLVFDAAHAFGSKYKEKYIAGFGNAEVFSLHATKTLIAGEGGIITTNDSELLNDLNKVRNFGFKDSVDTLFVGTNAKMSEIHALIGLDSLTNINSDLQKKKELVAIYQKELNDLPGISFQKVEKNTESSYFFFSIVIDPIICRINRDQLAEYLLKEGIQTRKYFFFPVHKQTAYKEYNHTYLPTTDKVASRILCLPTHVNLTIEDIYFICEKIKKALLNYTINL